LRKNIKTSNKKPIKSETEEKKILPELKYQKKSRDEIYLTLQRFLLIFMRDSSKELE
jgi:hypothetical protein